MSRSKIVGPFTSGDQGRSYYQLFDGTGHVIAEFNGSITDEDKEQVLKLLNAGARRRKLHNLETNNVDSSGRQS